MLMAKSKKTPMLSIFADSSQKRKLEPATRSSSVSEFLTLVNFVTPVHHISIPVDKADKTKGFGYVEFSTSAAAVRAKKYWNGRLHDGRKVSHRIIISSCLLNGLSATSVGPRAISQGSAEGTLLSLFKWVVHMLTHLPTPPAKMPSPKEKEREKPR